MNVETNKSGWMTREIFMDWLKALDEQLERKSLLLLDSCPAHSRIDFLDEEKGLLGSISALCDSLST